MYLLDAALLLDAATHGPSKIIISSCSTGFKLFFLIKLYSLKVRHVVEGDSL